MIAWPGRGGMMLIGLRRAKCFAKRTGCVCKRWIPAEKSAFCKAVRRWEQEQRPSDQDEPQHSASSNPIAVQGLSPLSKLSSIHGLYISHVLLHGDCSCACPSTLLPSKLTKGQGHALCLCGHLGIPCCSPQHGKFRQQLQSEQPLRVPGTTCFDLSET